MTQTPFLKPSNGPVVLFGSTGMLGTDLMVALRPRLDGRTLLIPTRTECDISNESSLLHYLAAVKPGSIVNCAAWAKVDQAETDRAEAFAANVTATAAMARFAGDRNISLLHFSTDQVFDGKKGTPYCETDVPNPINYYAETKWLGEQAALKHKLSAVVRIQWLYGRTRDRFSPLANKTEFSAFIDQFGAPTWTEELCRWVLPLWERGAHGIFHAVHDDYASWSEIFRFVIETTGWTAKLKEVRTEDAHLPAKRPNFSVLSNARLRDFLGKPGLGGFREPLRKFLLGNRVKT